MKRTLLLALSLMLAAASFAGDLRSEINATLKEVSAALAKRNPDAFTKALKNRITKDCKFVEMGQTMNFDQMVAGMKQGLTMIKSISKAEAKLVSLKESGKTATCVVSHVMAGKMMGPDNKLHSMGFTGKSTHSYKMVGGKWLMSSMVWGTQNMTMDGKPFDPSKMGG